MSDEFIKKVNDSISDENHDIEKYHQMSEEAKKCGCDCIAGVLADIAHDETTHRCLLEEMLKELPVSAKEHN